MRRNSMIFVFLSPQVLHYLKSADHVKPDMHHKEDENNQVLGVFAGPL